MFPIIHEFLTAMNNAVFCFLKLRKEIKETRELLGFPDHQVKFTTVAVFRH